MNLISIGRLVKQKNHILILKAIKNLPQYIDYKLLIIGDGEEKENLFNFIKENKLKKCKNFTISKKSIYIFEKIRSFYFIFTL